MVSEEKTRFIPDDEPNMTTEEKNMHLSKQLSFAPCIELQIVRIERIEGDAPGWRVMYRVSS